MSQRVRRFRLAHSTRVLAVFAATFSLACVERTVSINSEPQGAIVVLNDQEIGRTPVKVPFTWYGDYDIIIRKQGFKTIHTNHCINAPWYQLPPIDLFAECFVPMTLRDDRVLETYILEPFQAPDRQALLDRGDEMRARAAQASGAPVIEPEFQD